MYLERSSSQSLFIVSFSLFPSSEIDQPGPVDEQGLSLLELDLSKARTKNSQLKEWMSELEKTASLQRLRVQGLERSINEILEDIRNLEEIRNNLPLGCYNTKPIEKP